MKKYICKLCRKKNKEFVSTRKGLRDHFKNEHYIKSEIFNQSELDSFGRSKKRSNQGKVEQKWWIIEDI